MKQLQKIKTITNKSVFSIFPNPTNNNVNLQLNSTKNNTNVNVMNFLGEVVYKTKMDFTANTFNTLQISNWHTGIYTIIIETEEEAYYQKLIKY